MDNRKQADKRRSRPSTTCKGQEVRYTGADSIHPSYCWLVRSVSLYWQYAILHANRVQETKTTRMQWKPQHKYWMKLFCHYHQWFGKTPFRGKIRDQWAKVCAREMAGCNGKKRKCIAMIGKISVCCTSTIGIRETF